MGKVLILIKWNVDSRNWVAIGVRLLLHVRFVRDFNHVDEAEPIVVLCNQYQQEQFLVHYQEVW